MSLYTPSSLLQLFFPAVSAFGVSNLGSGFCNINDARLDGAFVRTKRSGCGLAGRAVIAGDKGGMWLDDGSQERLTN